MHIVVYAMAQCPSVGCKLVLYWNGWMDWAAFSTGATIELATLEFIIHCMVRQLGHIHKLECGPMPNVMVTLPNIGGTLCSTPQNLADAHYYMPCSNAAKTRKPLKVAGVPQTPETISAASGPKFTILWAHVEEILLLNKFFSDCRYMP